MKTSIFLTSLLLIACGCSSPPPEPAAPASIGSIERVDPAFDALVPADAQIEKVADGFSFIEGPLWRPEGAVWFSDVVGNVVRSWSVDGTVTEILNPGGYDGNSLPEGGFIGPNGMTVDQDGSVLLCQHGNRRIVRIAADGTVTTLIDSFEGKKLNSPNDLVFHSDGSLYFTDPPYGLPGQDEDPMKELDFNGVFRYADGQLTVVVRDLPRPNGIAFSPDYQTLYVANSEEDHRYWMAYDVNDDGSVSNGRVLADVSAEPAAGLPDGMKVDQNGNLFATGPGGVWVMDSTGKHIGTISLPEQPANVGWGDDGRTLYMTAETGLYRIKLSTAGMLPLYAAAPRGIELHVDLKAAPEHEKEMLRAFQAHFRQGAEKQPGFLDVELLKLRDNLMGRPLPAGVNYRFVIRFRTEEQRLAWVSTDLHQRLWPEIEKDLASTDYSITLFDNY